MFVTTANALHPLRITGINTAKQIPLPVATPSSAALLTQRLAAGDEAAFREFHALYFDRLYQFLLVVARGQPHEAQDALQETLLRVTRHVRVFETEDAFWGWLKVVARNAARDAGRKHQRYLALLQRFALGRQNLVTGAAAGEDDRLGSILEESLDGLEPPDRRLIAAKYLEGATVKELAAQTGLTDKAVESRLLRLRRQLREIVFKKLRSP